MPSFRRTKNPPSLPSKSDTPARIENAGQHLLRQGYLSSNASIVTSESSTAPPIYSVMAPLSSPPMVSDPVDDNNASTTPQSSRSARYVYYRIYTQDIGIVSKQPASCDQPYVGRIKATSVPPPRTTYSLKRTLCKIEKIADYASASLFITNSSPSPIGDTERSSFFSDGGPGSSPNEPISLVVQVSDEELGLNEVRAPDAPDSEASSSAPRYVYYRIYEDSDIPSKNPIDADDPSLARIDANLIPPPHTSSSIIRCICRIENHQFDSGHKLFSDTSEALIDQGHVSVLPGDVGSTPEDALALVKEPDAMNRKFKATGTIDYSMDDSRWLNLTEGHVYHTDGIVREEAHNLNGAKLVKCYHARNSTGRTGFVHENDVMFEFEPLPPCAPRTLPPPRVPWTLPPPRAPRALSTNRAPRFRQFSIS